MKTTITAQVVDQTLTVTNAPKLASGGENVFQIELTLDSYWMGYGLEAVFYRDKKRQYRVVLVDGVGLIPWELTAEPGEVYFSVRGVSGSTVRSTEAVVLSFVPGSPAAGSYPAPLPDVYKQVLSAQGRNAQEIKATQARIDNQLSAGTVDGELKDVRMGVGGETYASAGTAVREQVADIRRHHIKPNLLDYNKLSAGYLNNTDGVVATVLGEDCYYSDYIAVDNTLPYYMKIGNQLSYTTPWQAINTYDADKKFIARVSDYVDGKKYDFADNVAYVRVSFRGLYLHDAKFEQSAYPTATEHQTSPNLHDVYPLTMPGYVDSPGTIHNPTQDGYITEGVVADERHSRFMPVSAGEVYVFYNGVKEYPWCGVGFYNADGHSITRVTFTTGETEITEVTVPDGAVAMRYSSRMYTRHSFVLYKKTGFNDYMDAYVKSLIESHTDPIPVHHSVKAVAHRGYSAKAPENTLPAYKLAKQKGFEYVECDVSFTSDGVAVLLHDSTIDRTSSGTGNVADLTYAGLRALDFGSWFSADYAGTPIPTFEEFLLLCRAAGLRPYIEVKTGTQEQVKGLVETVIRLGMRKESTWISFSADILNYIKNTDTSARLGYVVDTVTAATVTTAQRLLTGKNEVFIDSGSYTEDAVSLCATAKIPMEVWTVNNATTIQNLPAYITGVTSDVQHAGAVLLKHSMG